MKQQRIKIKTFYIGMGLNDDICCKLEDKSFNIKGTIDIIKTEKSICIKVFINNFKGIYYK